jgi:hypothetical protein
LNVEGRSSPTGWTSSIQVATLFVSWEVAVNSIVAAQWQREMRLPLLGLLITVIQVASFRVGRGERLVLRGTFVGCA